MQRTIPPFLFRESDQAWRDPTRSRVPRGHARRRYHTDGSHAPCPYSTAFPQYGRAIRHRCRSRTPPFVL